MNYFALQLIFRIFKIKKLFFKKIVHNWKELSPGLLKDPSGVISSKRSRGFRTVLVTMRYRLEKSLFYFPDCLGKDMFRVLKLPYLHVKSATFYWSYEF